jgi:GT2 family glycosyltransferase
LWKKWPDLKDISLITSLFRSESHLESYSQYVLDSAARLKNAGLSLEVILVANEASELERDRIGQLAASAEASQTAAVLPLYVERETIYASWNRGVRAASGRCIGFWNMDDVREAGALIEGHRLIQEGCALVDFPLIQVTRRKWLPDRCVHFPAPYNPNLITPKMGVGPFFLFARSLYEQAGPFDEHFRICGDFEWSARQVVRTSCFCAGSSLGGRFVIHGANLSSTHNPLEWVEFNIILMRHDQWQTLRPVDPELMRATWVEWGCKGISAPDKIQDWLWGSGAAERWRCWQHTQRQMQRSRVIRALLRWIIDHTGLRSALARLGIVKPARQA